MRKHLLTFVLSASACISYAQDIHFSQFDNAPLFTNIGQTGMFNGDYRFTANYRTQWASVPVPYTTFAVGADMRLLRRKLDKDVLGAGLLITHDKAGDSQLSTSSIVASIAFTKQIAQNIYLFGGTHAGVGQRRFRTDQLRFDDQYTGSGNYDPSTVSADLGNLQNTAFRYFDIGAGFGVRYQRSRRSNLNVGVNMFHLNTPKQTFMGTQAQLAARLNFYASGVFRLAYKWDLMPSFQYQSQPPYTSTTWGAALRYHLNQNLGRETSVWAGTWVRNRDAIIPTLGLSYQTWQVVLSYDINVSNFSVATNRNGAIELSLMYIAKRVPDMGAVKTCPIL